MANVLVTGQPGVGKTTLIREVCQRLQACEPPFNLRGFYTEELREGGQRVGFDLVSLDGSRRSRLSRVDTHYRTTIGNTNSSANSSNVAVSRLPHVGQYAVDVESIRSHALPELQLLSLPASTGAAVQLYVVDEVGRMELKCRDFMPAVRRLLDHPHVVVLATIPTPKYGRDIAEVADMRARPDVTLFTVTKANRDSMPSDVTARVKEALAAAELQEDGNRHA